MQTRMKRRLILLTIALMMLPAWRTAAQSTRVENYDYLSEIKQYEEAVKGGFMSVPTLLETYNLLVEDYTELREYAAALRWKEAAIKVEPVYRDSIYAELLRLNGRYVESAAVYYDLHMPISPALSFALQNLDSNYSFALNFQPNIKTIGALSGLSYLDGRLICATTALTQTGNNRFADTKAQHNLFSAKRQRGMLANPDMDAEMTAIDPEMDYVVRHPLSRNIYYTKPNSKGGSSLYEVSTTKKGKQHIEQVKPGKSNISISHPTFTSDGEIMVFASDNLVGFGGWDLWYCQLTPDGWSEPQNMGHRINTENDEIAPYMYGDYLIFASDGRADNFGGFDLYSTRLLASDALPMGDTVGMLRIGRSRIQNLYRPINSSYDDFDLAADSTRQFGYWVSHRDTSSADDRIFGFEGGLECISLHGDIYDSLGRLVPEVAISAADDKGMCFRITSGPGGNYRLFLHPGVTYTIRFVKENYFDKTITVTPRRTDPEVLIEDLHQNIVLKAYPLGQKLEFANIFEDNANVEIAQKGWQSAEQIAQFMRDNSSVKLNMQLCCYLTDDAVFNGLLNGSRIESLKAFFGRYSIGESRIQFQSVVTPAEGESPDVKQTLYCTFSH